MVIDDDGFTDAPGGMGYIPRTLDEEKAGRHLSRDRVPEAAPRVRKMWKSGQMLNQKSIPACAGFAMTAELIAAPVGDFDLPYGVGNRYALNHYRRAQYLFFGADAYPEAKDVRGSSIDSNARVAVERGQIEEYLWAQTHDEVRDAVLTTGPVVVGVPWFRSMNKTRDDGYCKVVIPEERPDDLGYHAVCLTGYDPDIPIEVKGKTGKLAGYRVRNSWGHMWGSLAKDSWKHTTGNGWILEEDMARLLAYNTEAYGGRWVDKACLVVGRKPFDLEALLEAHPDPTVS